MSDRETGVRATIREIEQTAHGVILLQTFLRRAENSGRMSRKDRLLIVNQALLLLEMNYVHLPLKRAMHAIDPIQRLKLLKFRLETKSSALESVMQFHQRMLEIFASLRDLHTLYLLPDPFKSHTAFLPFLIEQCFERRGQKLVTKFLITRIVDKSIHRDRQKDENHIAPGVEVLYWNGVPIKRVIEINGDSQGGSNSEARFARGLDNLTIRPLKTSMPPDEKWVDITYRSSDGKIQTSRFEWLVYNSAEQTSATLKSKKKRAAIDIKKTMINELKKKFFTSTEVRIANRFKDNFYAEVRNIDGREFGYIRLFSFEVGNSDRFVAEFKRVITAPDFPTRGLIIDVRGNGGGKIRAGERLLQLFTPRRVKPELFEFINSPLNLEICRRDSVYQPWANSIAEAVVTGATYSLGFPVTPEEDSNDIGQVYYGPVVLITDALSYSATDMFAAGFQDNDVGPILGTSDNTGAGGANVWWYDDFRSAVGKVSTSVFKPLPQNADLVIAMRRSIRVGQREGRPLEEFGIAPDYRHYMTKHDLLDRNVDLLKQAAGILAKRPVYKLTVKTTKGAKRTLRFTASSEVGPRNQHRQISRVDVSVNGRPLKTLTAKKGELQGTFSIYFNGKVEWQLQAFDHKNRLVASARS